MPCASVTGRFSETVEKRIYSDAYLAPIGAGGAFIRDFGTDYKHFN